MSEVEQAVCSDRSVTKPIRVECLKAMVSVFCDPTTWHQIDCILLADTLLVYTIGYHPQHLKKTCVKPEEIRKMENHPHQKSCVGISEIGQDYHHAQSSSKRENQRWNFMSILEMMKSTGTRKPIVLHLRNSQNTDDPDNVFPHALHLIQYKQLDSHKFTCTALVVLSQMQRYG